jgi:iron complex transport system ATP-binding protein
MSSALLDAHKLTRRHGERTVLDGVNLRVDSGSRIAVVGPNGAGKSTLLRAALGLVDATGSIAIAGRNAAAMSARERARHIAYLPQEREIAWAVSVEDVVSLGRAPARPAFAGLGATDQAKIDDAMRRMEVDQFRTRPATALSGGEKARVLIARALVQEAKLLLADEPTAGLDPSHQIAVMRLFSQLASEGNGVIASVHDLGLAARWCTRLILIDKGDIVADGPASAVLTPERLRRHYGVEAYFGEAGGNMLVVPLNPAEPPGGAS